MALGDLVLSARFPFHWGEMDAFGHVNNVAYFRWLETARMHYLRAIGITHPDDQNGLGLLLAETTCTFLKPLHFPDTVTVRTGLDHIGNTSFRMRYEVHSEAVGLAATAVSVQVMFDYNTNAKTPVPASVRERIERVQSSTISIEP
ncbi:MAG: acyl-CoA thioesterase [Flavobacteriales bacterium]|nr:MAG: acyl-CoA thioesterase [Flavobacteriales bacterium]